MTEFRSDDLGIFTDELTQPGYVFFDCARWGAPDNTQGRVGYHVAYRPLYAMRPDRGGYRDLEHITAEMCDAVREHYARAQAAETAANAEREARARAEHEARMAKLTDPAYRAAQAERARLERAYDQAINEGGEGYNPYRGA